VKRFNIKRLKEIFWETNNTYRRLLLLISDLILIKLSVDLAIWYRGYNSLFFQESITRNNFTILLILNLIFFYIFTGHYKSITRYLSSVYLYFHALRNLIAIFSSFLILSVVFKASFDFSFWVLIFLNINLFSGGIRIIFRDLLAFRNRSVKKNVLIYGKGEDFYIELSSSLRYSNTHRLVGIIDEKVKNKNNTLNNVLIHAPINIDKICLNYKIDEIWLCISKFSKKEVKNILSYAYN